MIQSEHNQTTPGYQRVYRATGLAMIGFVILVFSIALSRSMGLAGLLLPSLVVATVYLLVTLALDALIYVLELRNGSRDL